MRFGTVLRVGRRGESCAGRSEEGAAGAGVCLTDVGILKSKILWRKELEFPVIGCCAAMGWFLVLTANRTRT